MRTEFRAAIVPDDVRRLMAFDRKVFPPGDRFTAWYWRQVESWWMLVDEVRVGCCAFAPDADFHESAGGHPPEPGSLYIASTGILPAYQGRGFGTLLKAWQICYARQHGFTRIVTNTRQRNDVMIRLNRKFHFRTIRTSAAYYADPPDATGVMELRLERDR